MFKGIFVCFLAFSCVDYPALCQADKAQPSTAASAMDEEYRKFGEVSDWVRARNARDYAMSSANGIDEGTYVTIGGIDQWITIRGEDRSNPVLYFCTAVPATSPIPGPSCFFTPWEKYFTIVQWDQRGAGRTLRKTGPSVTSTMSVDRMTKDGIEVAEYLRNISGRIGSLSSVIHSAQSLNWEWSELGLISFMLT